MSDDHRLSFSIEAEATGTSARAARFTTLHNEVQTPVFMPVATFAALRNQNTVDVEALGFPVLLANTYHLLLRPGTEVFRRIGGIHRFMDWKRSILTDSGGYQIFSLAESRHMTEEGACFRSYLDGRTILLSPERSIDTQIAIGGDIMMALDHCVSSRAEESIVRQAVDVTARWAERSLRERGESPQALFGIVQGGCSEKWRRISAAQITSLPFDGFALGGLAVGETESERKDITEMTAALLPRHYPRYLMGVGTPIDLLEAVKRGMDMFDCIIPTAVGQQGVAYTSHGRMQLRRSVYKVSDRPLDDTCRCLTCRRYTRSYLHHLIKADQYLGASLVGLHNLSFYKQLMDEMRMHILSNDFLSYYLVQREELARIDEEHPVRPPKRKKRKNSLELGAYEIIEQKEEFHSIRHKLSGEVMHSVCEPIEEARALYVGQIDLATILSLEDQGELILWDVGLGAAANAMATILALEEFYSSHEPLRALKLFSFENDLDSLRLAFRHSGRFPYLRHAAPATLLRHGRWVSNRIPCEWVLVEGDFLQKLDSVPCPHYIYYDPFSLNTDVPMWSLATFERIFRHSHPSGTRLFTYSASTRVRCTLLAAGFFVGKGIGTGPKTETTIALSGNSEGHAGVELLGREWFTRFERSGWKADYPGPLEEKLEIERRVRLHRQFHPPATS